MHSHTRIILFDRLVKIVCLRHPNLVPESRKQKFGHSKIKICHCIKIRSQPNKTKNIPVINDRPQVRLLCVVRLAFRSKFACCIAEHGPIFCCVYILRFIRGDPVRRALIFEPAPHGKIVVNGNPPTKASKNGPAHMDSTSAHGAD